MTTPPPPHHVREIAHPRVKAAVSVTSLEWGATVFKSNHDVTRIEKEFRIMQYARCAGAVHVADVFGLSEHPSTEPPCKVLSMPYAGSCLVDVVSQLDVPQRTSIGLQMVDAVRCLHALSVVHLDLKPDNMTIGCDGVLRLIDFETAEYLPVPSTLLQGVVGTVAYSPPEIAQGGAFDGFKADLWSLAVCLFAVHLEVMPFGALEDVALRKRQLRNAAATGCAFAPTLALYCKQRGGDARAILDARCVGLCDWLESWLRYDPALRASLVSRGR